MSAIRRVSPDIAYLGDERVRPLTRLGVGLTVRGGRNGLRVLDACLQRLEDDHEGGKTQVTTEVAKTWSDLVPGLDAGMLISDALDLVFREQERWVGSAHDEPGTLGPEPSPWHQTDQIASLHVSIEPRRNSGTLTESDEDGPIPDAMRLTPAMARELTDQIKTSLHRASVLLMDAHDGRAWFALGYRSWSQYVRVEFKLSRSRSYELVDHGRVLKALASAAGMSGIPDISPFAAQQIKPHLDQIAAAVAVKASGLPERQAHAVVLDLVESCRSGRSSTDRDVSTRGPESDKDLWAVRDAGTSNIDIPRLLSAINCLANLPPASEVAQLIPPDEKLRLASLSKAARWLEDMADVWSRAHRPF